MIEVELVKWLDPISGLGTASRYFARSCVDSLWRGIIQGAPSSRGLVTAWVQLRICPMAIVVNYQALAPQLIDALFDAIERSTSHTQSFARLLATSSLVPSHGKRMLHSQ